AEILADRHGEEEPEARKAAENIVSYRLPARVAAAVLEEVQGEFLRQGHFVVRAKLGIGTEFLALLPTADPYAVLACLGPNPGGGVPYNIGWLKELEQEQPFALAGCGYDTLKVRFRGPVRDPDRLARRIFKLGPNAEWRPDEIGVLAGDRLTQTERVKDLAE